MTDRTLDEQITKYLTDVHSIEEQALAQLRLAPRIAGSPSLGSMYPEHLNETHGQERAVRERLEQRGAQPSTVKDVAGRVGGWGMVLFARVNPDSPGKLAMHAFSYAHMELAAYEVVRRVAGRAADPATIELARRVGEQERAMADRVAARWDEAVEASLAEKGAEDLQTELVKYLRDAHALEAQAMQLLEAGPKIADARSLAAFFSEHLEQTREHQRLVDERLAAHDAGPSRFQAAGMRVGALNIGTFFKGQPDTPAKLAGFAYAFEALETGAYELLSRVARRAGDEETVSVAQRIVAEERAAAERVAGTWDEAMSAGLQALGVAT